MNPKAALLRKAYRDARVDLGLTVQEASRMLNVQPTDILRLERNAPPRVLQRVCRICRNAFEVSAGDATVYCGDCRQKVT